MVKVLCDEGFDSLPALLNAGIEDIECLKFPRGLFVRLRTALRQLKSDHGCGPLISGDGGDKSRQDVSGQSSGTLVDLLAGLNISGATASTPASKPKGEALRMVEFVSASMIAEEEVTLGFLWIPLVLNVQSIAKDHIRAVLL